MFGLTACSGGSSDSTSRTGGDFVVLRTTPPDNGKLFLNDAIRIDFSNPVDLSSADLNTVTFQVFDLNGTPLSEQPAGRFSVGTSIGDQVPGRQLLFTPEFPTNNAYTNGGFKPGRLYILQLVGGTASNDTTLRDVDGRRLTRPVTLQFQTADGSTPSALFSDTRPGGPRRTSFDVTPRDSSGVALNKLGLEQVEIRLGFDQPLNPNDANVPVNMPRDPMLRSTAFRGRIYLQFDQPGQSDQWIPATVDLESNRRDGSVVVLRPIGVLPNNALIEVVVDNTVEDMSGESNAADVSYDRTFATFETRSDFEPQYDALIESFDADTELDLTAAFLEPLATAGNGRVAANFSFAGSEQRLEYRPTEREVVLDTNVTQITPYNNPPITVAGGVFNFAAVEIAENVVVRGVGSNPMVWLISGDLVVNGTLQVDGRDGGQANAGSAAVPTPGGLGVCGGGSGGRGSPNTTDRSETGEAGFGPGGEVDGGGEPGRIGCTVGCNRGSGGGGGSFAAEGDPHYPLNRLLVGDWPQINGEGGSGCLSRTLPGGRPGPRVFVDSRDDNDFWGSGVNLFRSMRVTGELLAPQGGQGGGGGGDRAQRCTTGDPGFISDKKAGGGGGGGGVLLVQALGTIKIGPRGKISANGGHGRGGEQQGSNNEGGGGGGGSGGMVILMAGGGFEIAVHGDENAIPPRSTYGESDFNFAISADGGVGLQGHFGGVAITGKYPFGSNAWSQKAAGGFGSPGVVQMLLPPGDDSDGTGNRLDDNIRFTYLDNQGIPQDVSPARKKALLAWRGWPDGTGQRVDDDGNPIVLTGGTPPGPNPAAEGDIRPSPILLPSPYGAISRARSTWIDLGAVARERRDQAPGPNDPLTVVAPLGTEPRPDFGDVDLGFAGTSRAPDDRGYIAYDPANGTLSVPVVQPGGIEFFDVASIDTGVQFGGAPAYQIELVAGSSLGAVADRYAHYRVQPFDAGGEPIRVGGREADYRILGHSDRFIFVAPEANIPVANVARLRVLAKFFDVSTDGAPGLGLTRTASAQVRHPVANTRIGFAFHTDPKQGLGPARWPNGTVSGEELFEYDLRNPAFLTWLESNRPSFVQWDVLFNLRYDPNNPGNLSGEPLTSELPIQSLDYIVLPYRF